MDEVEWGTNRDQEQLGQINLCLLMGARSRLPIYQTITSGSLKDVSTLKTTLAKMDAVTSGKPLLLVMDKGFFSAKNINDLLDRSLLRFIIAVPFTSNFAKTHLSSESKSIDSVENTLVIGSDSIRALTQIRSWNREHKLFVHVNYNVLKAMKTREELYAHVTLLKEQAQADPAGAMQQNECKKYLRVANSEKAASGYAITIKNDMIDKELKHALWMVLIANDISDAREALLIYHEKDVVEKGFLRFMNSLDLCRLHVHQENSMQNKTFVGFLALILLSQIHKVMQDQGLYKIMTMQKLLMTLSKLRVQEINGTRILFPLTLEQKSIYKAFSVDEPV
jgi:transposase